MRLFLSSLIFLAIMGSARAQTNSCTTSPVVRPDIEGTYVDNYGGTQIISDHLWTSGALSFEICLVNNGKDYVVAHNDINNKYFPGKFSRFEWTKSGDTKLWYCQIVYDAATEQAAISAPPADPNNPAIRGCGQFPWSELIRRRQP